MQFAVLITGKASSFCLQHYGDYGRLFIDLLSGPGETWNCFDVTRGAYPPDPDAYDGYVITGSAADAHVDEPWILKLKAFIKTAYSKRQRILGLCFGHQVVAGALGGVTGRNPAGWELGIHSMGFDDHKVLPSWFPQESQGLRILEIHRDHVINAPPQAETLAWTPDTPCQIFALGGHVLCLQGHPEFNNEIVLDLVESRMAKGVISREKADATIPGLKNSEPDRATWRAILRSFLYDKPFSLEN